MNAPNQAWQKARTTRSPEDFSAYLETVDPLYAASSRLDAAAAEFARICAAPGTPDEAAFGRVEAAVVQARAEFRRLLTARVGMDAGAVERRLGL